MKTRLVLIGCGCLVIAGCRDQPAAPPRETVTSPEPARTEPLSPAVPIPPVDRETLLIAALRAASAAATQRDDRLEQRELDGRRFVVRERFGCAGPAQEGPRRWEYREESGTLRVRFEPLGMNPDAQPAETDQERSELVAFPISQPWLLSAACPPAAAAAPVAGGRVVLAQSFTPEDSRATRPPEAYSAVKPISAAEVPAEGLEFVLVGRLQADAGARVIRCAASTTGGRPDCVVNIVIDGARIEDPARNVSVGTWGNL